MVGYPFVPVVYAHFKHGGVFHQGAVGNGDITLGGVNFKIGRVGTQACIFFKESVNAVKNTATVAANNLHAGILTLGDGGDAIGILTKRCGIDGKRDGEAACGYGNPSFLKIFRQLTRGGKLGRGYFTGCVTAQNRDVL